MNFKQALNYIYNNRRSDTELLDPFALYCKLSDLCASSYQDKDKVALFYQINRKINIIQLIMDDNFDVQSSYLAVEDLVSFESFKGLVKTVKTVLGMECVEVEKIQVKPKNVVVQKVVVQKAEEPEEVETRTPLNIGYSYNNSDSKIWFCILGGVALALALLVALACIFHWPWTFWQFFIGIVGGCVLGFILSLTVILLDDAIIVDYYVSGTFILGLCLLVNFVLLLIFKDNYKIIFYCFTVLELIIGVILAGITFDDYEEGFGTAQVIELITAIILAVIAIIWV